MKAQTFLEWYKDNSCFSRATIDEDISSLNYVANFYSQPFRPEMITELFEGWGTKESPQNIVLTNSIHEIGLDDEGYMLGKNGLAVNCWQMPFDYHNNSTLNDLISDCQRAGIELHWKPEIEKEYFA